MDDQIMNEDDTVFQSQFERANRAKKPDDATVSRVESDDENGWLNVRVDDARWEAAQDLPRQLGGAAHQGRIENAPPATTDRVSFSDPVADNLDPTDPGSPT
jgi:hypothetical protein